ncbi:MAG TPA: AarF/ABC1/UbiB kinase family protein [Microthrixaceae bacterium]|nr:AarF/ABC1/UbiB kinase family protein [Microthrixaceae bacterium]
MGTGERNTGVTGSHTITGLRVFPRYLAPARRSEIARRAAQIGWVTTKHFTPLAVRAARAGDPRNLPSDAFARPLRLTFEELGTTFMKFGQLVASSPGVFGDEVAGEFRACLDTGPAESFELVRRVVEADLGMPLEDAFERFDEVPIGRASIAVVHRARLYDGTEVAVKVLRPGIEKRVSIDMDLFQPMLEIVARTTGEYAAGQLLQMFDGFRLQLGEELDLRNEARAIQHMQELLHRVDLPLVTVPAVHDELCGPRTLTMEFIEGIPVDDLTRIQSYGFDPAPVVSQTVKGFLLTTIRWGFFHGDVHAGNLLLRPDGRIGVIDWGIIGRLDPDTHQFFRHIVEAGLGDEAAWPEIAKHTIRTYGTVLEEGLGMTEDDLTQFMRVTLEPLLRSPFGEVSLVDILNAPQQKVAEARGIQAERLTVRGILRRFREQREVRRLADEAGVYESEFERGLFLLTKALMYFERYGKMYMSDVGLFDDERFFREALAQPMD